MRIIVKNVNESPMVTEIKGDLEEMQNIVDGHIETYPIGNNVLCVCNDDGKILNMPTNFFYVRRGHAERFVGDVFFVSVSGEEFASLSDEQIDIIMKMFHSPIEDVT